MDGIMREIAIMKKVHHPNVLRLYEVMDDPKVTQPSKPVAGRRKCNFGFQRVRPTPVWSAGTLLKHPSPSSKFRIFRLQQVDA